VTKSPDSRAAEVMLVNPKPIPFQVWVFFRKELIKVMILNGRYIIKEEFYVNRVYRRVPSISCNTNILLIKFEEMSSSNIKED
jgi:hypothetical protein